MDSGRWDERYSTEELVWHAEPNASLVEEVGRAGLLPGRALDLACGEGRNSLWLAAQGWQVTGVDFSRVAIAKAKQLAAQRSIEVDFLVADVVDWVPPAQAFDLVVVMYLHLEALGRRRSLRLAAGAVAKGGTLLVVGHDSANLAEGVGGPQSPALLFSPEDLVADLDGLGLSVVRAAKVLRPVATDEGQRNAVDALLRATRP